MEFSEVHTRIPAGLWDSLQTVCFRQDNKFIEDVGRILGVPAAEIRRKVLGVRGVPTTVITMSGPWWEGQQCALMIKGGGGLWKRCGHMSGDGEHCWKHRRGPSRSRRRYDDPYFVCLKKRTPFSLEGEIVWVSSDGSVMTGGGVLLKGVTINPINGVANYICEEKAVKAESAEGRAATPTSEKEAAACSSGDTAQSATD
jgi:hypothetical protein